MATYHWLEMVFDLKAKIAKAPAKSRAGLIKTAASKWELEATTVRRQLVAADHVAQWIAREGLQLADVRASLIAIDTLRRLELAAPSKAALIRREVLEGKRTQRSVIDALKSARQSADHKSLYDLIYTAIGLCEMDNIKIDGIVGRGHNEISQIGRILDIDAEARSEKTIVGIFISPSLTIEGRRISKFGQQIFKIISALAFYKKVVLGCARHEGEELIGILAKADKPTRDRIRIYDYVADPD